MTPSNDLFNLIKSLTPPEKKIFKMYFSGNPALRTKSASGGRRDGEKTYMVLYNAIDRQKQYNEQKIKKRFAKQLGGRSFSDSKNYLFHLILETLRSYYPGDLPDFTIREMIEKAIILNEKKLTGAAWKLIRKAKHSAFENELFPEALQALEIERKIIAFQDAKVYEQLITDNLAQAKSGVEKYNNLMEYERLGNKMFMMYRTKTIVRNKQEVAFFEKMLEHPLLQSESAALSFLAKYLFYSVKGTCCRYLANIKKAYQYAQKLLAIFESVPMTNFRVIMYINALRQMAILQNSLGKFTDSMQNVRKMRDIGKLYPQFAKSIPPGLPFSRSIDIETDLYLHIPDYETGMAQIPYIESDLKKFRHALPKYAQYILYYNIAMLYFGTGNYHKALYWVNNILDENKDDYVMDLICASRIVFLVIHIELGNEDLLQYAAQSTYRYFTTRKRKYKVESVFLVLLKALFHSGRKKRMLNIYPQILTQFKKLNTDRYEKGAFEYFDFISWVESKISGMPFAEIVRKKAQIDKH